MSELNAARRSRAELDIIELGPRPAIDLYVENRLDRRAIGRWCRHLQRMIDIAHDRKWAVR